MPVARKFSVEDLWSLRTLGQVAVSPDGRRMAFEMHYVEREADTLRSALYLLRLDEQGQAEGEPRQLTRSAKSESFPAWAPDSRHLLFLSDREGEQNQLWLIDTDGGEARKLTTMLHGVNEAAWSPDGRWIAFTASTELEDEDDLLVGLKSLSEPERKKRDEERRYRLRVINDPDYHSDGRGYYDTQAHLFVMPAPGEDGAVDPAQIRRLTRGRYEHAQPAWTLDSQEIGVLSNRREDRFMGIWVRDLWAINPESGEERCLTEGKLAIESFSWSPDSQMAMVVADQDERIARSLARLYLVTRRGNVGDRTLLLTPDLDLATSALVGGNFGMPGPYKPQWSHDGQAIYFIASERGQAHVYRLEVVWRTLKKLTNESITYYLHLLPDKRGLLVAQERAQHPCEFYRLPLEGEGEPERLTRLYDDLMRDLAWPRVEKFSYEGAEGEEIDGWLVYPIGAKGGVRYPLLVQIHGGPHWGYGDGCSPYDAYLAARGYAIFYCNPHGSTGHGEAFLRGVLGDWGGKDFEDIMRGVDACIERGVADPERLVVTGYSYGGYMTMYIIGHTERFKAAVPRAGISNLASFVGTSDIGPWMTCESKGFPWDEERAAYYYERSPLNAAARVTTPTRFIHPENDLRCPIEQSEQFYMALKLMGQVPVDLVRVPGAWHGGTPKPSQSMAMREHMLAWFERYIQIRPEEYEG